MICYKDLERLAYLNNELFLDFILIVHPNGTILNCDSIKYLHL